MAIASIAGGIAKFFSGGVGKEIVEIIGRQFPGKLSDEELAEIERQAAELEHKREADAMMWAREQDLQFFQFTKDMEGTASDLKTIPYIGGLIIFFRGAFRPTFAYFTLWLDAQWFLTQTSSVWTDQQNTAMIVINVVVLVFFFGERAVKNLLPLIGEVFGKGSR